MNHDSSAWQQPPSIAAGLPFNLQLLATGAGVGVGCGVGVGFISPLNLGAIPALGQAAHGIISGLGPVGVWLGAAQASAQQVVRRLGVPGLDAGAGCGVLAGYYFGAGLMLKPSVLEQVAHSTTALAGRVSQALTNRMQHTNSAAADTPMSAIHTPSTTSSSSAVQAGQAPQHFQAAASATGSSPSPPAGPLRTAAATDSMFGGSGPPAPLMQQQQQQQLSGSSGVSLLAPAEQQLAHTPPTPPQQQQQQQLLGPDRSDDAMVTRLLLQQQADIAALKQQNRQLRAAVCKLDPTAAVCGGRRQAGRGRRGARGSGRQSQHDDAAAGGAGISDDSWSN